MKTDLNALKLAEYRARDAYNDLRLAYMSAASAHRCSPSKEAAANLFSARAAADEALRVFNAARIARLLAEIAP